ncbi:hypothetical protein HMPREF1322_0383 [Porphyromonas gingivalis W50]|nr:hypothetical protein HMPREF1322_0383 [Porphyromonas gingivalis W50]
MPHRSGGIGRKGISKSTVRNRFCERHRVFRCRIRQRSMPTVVQSDCSGHRTFRSDQSSTEQSDKDYG